MIAFSEFQMRDIVRPKVTEAVVMAEWSEECFHVAKKGEEALKKTQEIATN